MLPLPVIGSLPWKFNTLSWCDPVPRKSVSERQKARQFAACPEFLVDRSSPRAYSGTLRPAGRLAGIRMISLRHRALLPSAGVCARGSAGFERILRLATLAFPMAQDAVNDPWIRNKRDDSHAGVTTAEQRVNQLAAV